MFLKTKHIYFIICIALAQLFAAGSASAQEPGLLIPLPKTGPAKQVKEAETKPKVKKQDGTIIPLPINPTGNSGVKQTGSTGKNPELLIPLPLGGKTQSSQTVTDEPVISITGRQSGHPTLSLPGEVTIPATKEPSIEIPEEQPQVPAVQPVTLPVFPKDTSSAIFMVMKTWECIDYDGPTLVEHAAKVYGEEAADGFTVEGLDAVPPFVLTLSEEDVTFDELLDIIAHQTGLDWGVDIPQKKVYIYPSRLQ